MQKNFSRQNQVLSFSETKKILKKNVRLTQALTCKSCQQIFDHCTCEGTVNAPMIVRTDQTTVVVKHLDPLVVTKKVYQQEVVKHESSPIIKQQLKDAIVNQKHQNIIHEHHKDIITQKERKIINQNVQPIIHEYIQPVIHQKHIHEIHQPIVHQKEQEVIEEEHKEIRKEERKEKLIEEQAQDIRKEEYAEPIVMVEKNQEPIIKKQGFIEEQKINQKQQINQDQSLNLRNNVIQDKTSPQSTNKFANPMRVESELREQNEMKNSRILENPELKGQQQQISNDNSKLLMNGHSGSIEKVNNLQVQQNQLLDNQLKAQTERKKTIPTLVVNKSLNKIPASMSSQKQYQQYQQQQQDQLQQQRIEQEFEQLPDQQQFQQDRRQSKIQNKNELADYWTGFVERQQVNDRRNTQQVSTQKESRKLDFDSVNDINGHIDYLQQKRPSIAKKYNSMDINNGGQDIKSREVQRRSTMQHDAYYNKYMNDYYKDNNAQPKKQNLEPIIEEERVVPKEKIPCPYYENDAEKIRQSNLAQEQLYNKLSQRLSPNATQVVENRNNISIDQRSQQNKSYRDSMIPERDIQRALIKEDLQNYGMQDQVFNNLQRPRDMTFKQVPVIKEKASAPIYATRRMSKPLNDDYQKHNYNQEYYVDKHSTHQKSRNNQEEMKMYTQNISPRDNKMNVFSREAYPRAEQELLMSSEKKYKNDLPRESLSPRYLMPHQESDSFHKNINRDYQQYEGSRPQYRENVIQPQKESYQYSHMNTYPQKVMNKEVGSGFQGRRLADSVTNYVSNKQNYAGNDYGMQYGARPSIKESYKGTFSNAQKRPLI